MNNHNWCSTRQRTIVLTFPDDLSARRFDHTADQNGLLAALWSAPVTLQLELPL